MTAASAPARQGQMDGCPMVPLEPGACAWLWWRGACRLVQVIDLCAVRDERSRIVPGAVVDLAGSHLRFPADRLTACPTVDPDPRHA